MLVIEFSLHFRILCLTQTDGQFISANMKLTVKFAFLFLLNMLYLFKKCSSHKKKGVHWGIEVVIKLEHKYCISESITTIKSDETLGQICNMNRYCFRKNES